MLTRARCCPQVRRRIRRPRRTAGGIGQRLHVESDELPRGVAAAGFIWGAVAAVGAFALWLSTADLKPILERRASDDLQRRVKELGAEMQDRARAGRAEAHRAGLVALADPQADHVGRGVASGRRRWSGVVDIRPRRTRARARDSSYGTQSAQGR